MPLNCCLSVLLSWCMLSGIMNNIYLIPLEGQQYCSFLYSPVITTTELLIRKTINIKNTEAMSAPAYYCICGDSDIYRRSIYAEMVRAVRYSAFLCGVQRKEFRGFYLCK